MIVETIIGIGAGATALVAGTATAINWIRYSRSERAKVTGDSFLKHSYKKHFQKSRSARKGYAGEYETSRQLEKVKGHKKLLFNVLVPKGQNETAEIDILMIHETGIYVFENKNYSGTIGAVGENNRKQKVLRNVTAEAAEWGVQYSPKKIITWRNPIKQNEAHVRAVRRLLSGFNIGSQHFFSYIVFNNDAQIKGAPADFHTSVNVRLDRAQNLALDLNRKIPQCAKILTPQNIDKISSLLEKYSAISQKDFEAHVERVSSHKRSSEINVEASKPTVKPFQPLNETITSAAAQKAPTPQKEDDTNNRMKNYINLFRE